LKTLKDLTDYLETSTYPQYFNSEEKSKMKRQAQQYLVRNGILYKRNRQNSEQPLRVISKAEKDIILYNMHSDPLAEHFAIKGIVRRILERYYWPMIGEDVRNYVKAYDAC